MCLLSISFEEHWKDVLRQSVKSYETWKWNLITKYHEQVISVVDRAKTLPDAELIVKLASSSVGERIFRDLRSETYIPSEEKGCD